MKPFDLERALAGDKVVTRGGVEVKQLTKFDCSDDCLAGVVEADVKTWKIDGRYTIYSSTCHDLFMAPKTVKRWVNFYETEHTDRANGYAFETEAAAKRSSMSNAIAIAVPVEFEEGYGCE